MMKLVRIFIIVFSLIIMSNNPGVAQQNDIFKEYRQILPRGGIPAIINPVYVRSDQAEIDDDTWVLGVVINGQARAYSLNLLNHHEIVNDIIDTTAFAAVW
jgi:hypothetical protein